PMPCAERAPPRGRPIRLLRRAVDGREGGLSSAVVAGARTATGDWVVVMDADLQHPPAVAALLARTAMRHSADIVVGARYAGGGSVGQGLDGTARLATSSAATRL